ncbi:MAG: hypothetical protein ACR2JY_08175, partial [Chloroflexota bacterium]
REGAGLVIAEERSRNPTARGRVAGRRVWPTWEQPWEEALLALARMVTPLVRILQPELVFAVVKDNERARAVWAAALHACGIDAADYLWDGSATAFPGVRCYAGKIELGSFLRNRGEDTEYLTAFLDFRRAELERLFALPKIP